MRAKEIGMMSREFIVCVSPWLVLGALTRVGYFGTHTLDMRTRGDVVYEEPYKRNCGLFEFYQYVRYDTSEMCERVAPNCVRLRQWGLSLKPIEFKFQ